MSAKFKSRPKIESVKVVVGVQILGHLLPEFAPLVTTLSNLDGQTKELDLRTLRESILREENVIAKRLENDKQQPAPLPAIPLAHSAQNVGCSHCGNSRHSVERCWKRHPERKPDRIEPRNPASE